MTKDKKMTPEQKQEITELRDRNLTPKQIARKLGLRAAEVTAYIKEQAEEKTLARAASGELDPVVECFVNANCADYYLHENPDPIEETEANIDRGLALVCITRKAKYDRFTVCTYLLDVWCLGVKDTMGPRQLNSVEYKQMLDYAYQGFPEGPQKITLEQAQALVYSAVDYADQLGFKPHQDFQQSRFHLGKWSGQPKIQMGRNGKPFYISGPYDNPETIINILRKNVGEGNFDYMTQLFDDSDESGSFTDSLLTETLLKELL
ncbi:MAG: DNA-binding response regulator [Coleofasciculus sp. B1-GNL1-01]|uniref:DNA-binding response regulator n=1 Tax=Coleofasciculus sp. B1-GNL1-01 TaxID=3068484 RepID=UPI0032FD6AAC